MAEGMRIWNEAGQLVFDTNDRIAGVKINTGQTNGSYTATPLAGQSVEFVYFMPGTWFPSGRASRWPTITSSGNTVTWNYVTAVPQAERVALSIMVVYY